MTRIGVLGLGNWGTALANHLASNGHNVLGWCIEPEIAKGINEKHRNPCYQKEIELSALFCATNDLPAALNQEIVVLVFPSQFLAQMVPKLATPKGTILVSAIKGLESESVLTVLQYCEKFLPQKRDCCVISGPSFARDVVAGFPASVVAASKSINVAEQIAQIFTSNRFRVYISDDPTGVEVGGTVKNVISLAAGVCDALKLGDSARAGLITRGLAEMTRLAVAMGAHPMTLSGLSGLGDLIMTASSDTSRNRTVGLRLGKGESLEEITKTLGSVAEAVKVTPLVLKLAERYQVEMPISKGVSRLLKGQAAPDELMKGLLERPIKREFL